MGLFSGENRQPDRAAERAWGPQALNPAQTFTNYAHVNANGESALQSVAVGACIDLICSLASELPLDVFRGSGTERVQVTTPGYLQDPGGTGQGIEDWLYTLVQSWLYRGNAYGFIVEVAPSGSPRQIDLLHPDDVSVILVDGNPQWWVSGKPVQRPEYFLHRRVNPVAGRLLGASVVERHATQIGVSLSATAFGDQWFSDGAHPSGLLVNASDITQEQATTVKQRWMNLFRGTREPAVLGKGWDWKPIQINPAESQFLETQRYSEAQCARMFGPAMAETLGYETGGSMTYANVVDRRSDLLTFSLNRWLNRAERLLTMMLPAPQYARFNRDALLQSTTLARYEAHAIALRDKWRTVNEVRDIEELPPVPWGDVPNGASTMSAEAARFAVETSLINARSNSRD